VGRGRGNAVDSGVSAEENGFCLKSFFAQNRKRNSGRMYGCVRKGESCNLIETKSINTKFHFLIPTL
jgi:hypothetical protein